MGTIGSVKFVKNHLDIVLYRPYGEPLGAYTQSDFGFTGEQTDPNGLVYLRARNMNPTMGAFLSKDPVEGTVSRPMARNGYSYVEGNPSNWTDPSGEFIWLLALVAAEAAVGAIIGGNIAGLHAMAMYDQAIQCHCGKDMHDWAMSHNRQDVIN
ncbi:MAG: RHS repeat-associated core domain-containing protein [Chloroflexota bacterium]